MQEGKVFLRRHYKQLRKEETRRARENGKYIRNGIEFQRTASRNKTAFLREQCEKIEENNTAGKTRDFFKKIGDIRGTFHVRMGKIWDRNGKDLTESEEIRRGSKNIQNNYKKKKS